MTKKGHGTEFTIPEFTTRGFNLEVLSSDNFLPLFTLPIRNFLTWPRFENQ